MFLQGSRESSTEYPIYVTKIYYILEGKYINHYVTAVAKKEHLSYPLWGQVARSYGIVPINRTNISPSKINVTITGNALNPGVKTLKRGSSLVQAIACDQKKMFPCSVMLDQEYGLNDLCIGVPVILGKNGIEIIVEIELDAAESSQLKTSAEGVKATNTLLNDLNL